MGETLGWILSNCKIITINNNTRKTGKQSFTLMVEELRLDVAIRESQLRASTKAREESKD